MKKTILTVSLALALTMTASAIGNEVSRAKTLVAYFSFPIDSGKEALDATSGASVTIKNGRHFGNAQFIAMTVADTHGGSRSAGIEREIAAAEPNATVSKNMLILSRSDTAKSEQKIKDWAKGL